MSFKKYILVFQLSRVLRTSWVYILIRKLNVHMHAVLCAIANVIYLWCCIGFDFRRINDTTLKVCWKIQPNFPELLKRPLNARIPSLSALQALCPHPEVTACVRALLRIMWPLLNTLINLILVSKVQMVLYFLQGDKTIWTWANLYLVSGFVVLL